MALLRMRDATFATGAASAGPVTLNLESGRRAALVCASADEASIVALLAAGIVKASSGSVLIDDFDPRVQPVHCKRIAALVPHEPFALDEGEFERYLAYRAALWNVEAPRAFAHARLLRERLDGMHEALAYPLIAAMIGMPRLVVLDRPQPAYAEQILRGVAGSTLFSTHADPAAASAFA
jgi:ABC-type multidrug transport system ATPase subunit